MWIACLCFPQSRHCNSSLQCSCVGDGASKELIKVKWSHGAGVLIQKGYCPYDTRESAPSLPPFPSRHWGKALRTQQEGHHLQVMEHFHPRNQTCQHLEPEFPRLQGCKKISFCCLSHPSLWLSTTNWHLPRVFASSSTTKTTRALAICLCGDWSLSCCSCWLPTCPWGGQGGGRHSGLQGAWWNRSLDRYLQELSSWSQYLHLFISRLALKPSTIHQFLTTSRKPFVWSAFDCLELPLPQNPIYWPFFTTFQSSLSELSEVLFPRLQSLFCPK